MKLTATSVLILGLLTCGIHPAMPQQRKLTLLSGEIRVTATLKERIDSMSSYEIAVSRGAYVYRFVTMLAPITDEAEAIAALKESVGWKAGYLFVRTECGGGNRWRCNVEEAFELKNGRLNHIGEVLGDERRGELGKNYRDGWFINIYDRLEMNPLTSHVGAPGIFLYSRIVDGHLKVDLEHTWVKNHEPFGSTDEIERILAPNFSEADRDLELRQELLGHAVLAKYCRHETELARYTAIAKAHLSEQTDALFKQLLTKVVPGELPGDY